MDLDVVITQLAQTRESLRIARTMVRGPDRDRLLSDAYDRIIDAADSLLDMCAAERGPDDSELDDDAGAVPVDYFHMHVYGKAPTMDAGALRVALERAAQVAGHRRGLANVDLWVDVRMDDGMSVHRRMAPDDLRAGTDLANARIRGTISDSAGDMSIDIEPTGSGGIQLFVSGTSAHAVRRALNAVVVALGVEDVQPSH